MTPGFYPCSLLSNEDYHAGPGVSCTGLKVIGDQTPAHYRFGKFKDTHAKFIGTALHAATLEPDRFAAEYVIDTGFAHKNSNVYKAWKAAQTKIIIGEDEHATVLAMRASLFAHKTAGYLLRDAHEFELSAYANDPETGVLVRTRMDLFTNASWIVDVKKCQDASPSGARRSMEKYGYHVQAAFYRDVFEWTGGVEPAGFCFLFVEEEPPHAVGVYVIHPEDMQRGRELYRRSLRTYARCLERNDWPAYSQEAEVVEFSRYERSAIDRLVIQGALNDQ
jgi:hypothetical protein